jgi:hypothetical protein
MALLVVETAARDRHRRVEALFANDPETAQTELIAEIPARRLRV